MTPAIRVANLSKKYFLAHRSPQRYVALRDVISDRLRSLWKGSGRVDRSSAENSVREEFWALDGLSFEVAAGERVGIIGRNGAGKSTLLKVLSRITEPTSGRIEIAGRMSSLLEVGTGFHPELTGRENIYLNGAILGMSSAETRAKFGEIVAFADVERFLDTPVKHYSSGMYVRLAFAVAAHLNTDILVVDEVLAVGDAEFQKKCMARMSDVAGEGRTILLVSHNMGAIRALCNRVMWLDGGKVKGYDASDTVVEQYLSSALGKESAHDGEIPANRHTKGSRVAEVFRAGTLGLSGARQTQFLIGEPFVVELGFRNPGNAQGTFWIFICTYDGEVILSCLQKDSARSVELPPSGEARVRIEGITLLPGRFSIWAGILGDREIIDWVEGAADFEVLPQHHDRRPHDHRYGWLTHEFEWDVRSVAN